MATKYALNATLVDKERNILSAPVEIGSARLAYSTDTNKIFFFEGTKWMSADNDGYVQYSSSSSSSTSSSSSST